MPAWPDIYKAQPFIDYIGQSSSSYDDFGEADLELTDLERDLELALGLLEGLLE